jgi:hypothetical protein
MNTQNSKSYPLRLSTSMREQVTELARLDGISMNHFISLALAEKISRLEHDSVLKQQREDDANRLRAVGSRQFPIQRY